MKAEIDKDGYLKIDAQSFVQSLPDAVLRDIAKYTLFNELLLTGILEGLVNGTMWGDDGEPWWFDSGTFTKLRLQLLPLLPAITAEAVRYLEAEARRAKAEQARWNDAAWKLWHAWPDRDGRPEHPSYAYEHHQSMSKEAAEAYLRAVEATVAAERTELEQLRVEIAELRAKQAAFVDASR